MKEIVIIDGFLMVSGPLDESPSVATCAPQRNGQYVHFGCMTGFGEIGFASKGEGELSCLHLPLPIGCLQMLSRIGTEHCFLALLPFGAYMYPSLLDVIVRIAVGNPDFKIRRKLPTIHVG